MLVFMNLTKTTCLLNFLSFWLYWCYNHHLKENTFFFSELSPEECEDVLFRQVWWHLYSLKFSFWVQRKFSSVHCIISLSILICTWGFLLITIYETSTKNGKFNKFVVLKLLRETHLPFIDLKSLKQTVYWLMKKEVSIK